MVQELESNLYRLEIPLPKNPLRSVNCYLIRGSDRYLLIDTGMNRQRCLEEMKKDLEQLAVDLKITDFFITHLHVDHMGLVSTLASVNSRIYFNKIEASRVKKQNFWTQVYSAWLSNGFPEDELNRLLEEHPGRRYGPRKDIVFSLCHDGDKINVGEYSLVCIETPGHSPGHMCLYHAAKGILFSGDHLLGDITPNISAVGASNNEDPLGNYLKSLDKVYHLDVKMILPGHGGIFQNPRKRIKLIKDHHDRRLSQVVAILKDEPGLSAYELASRMSWEIKSRWSEFPVTQKWFAAGEALAHLIYLEKGGAVSREMVGSVWRYFAI